MTLLPEGGAALPVSVTTTRKVQGGAAIPVYGYMTAPTDGRPAMGGSAIPVRVLTAADLKQNGGMWTLEGRPYAMPVYTAPATTTVMGGPALAVYPVNAWPTVPVVPAWVPTDIAGLALWLKADAGLYKDAAKAQPVTADADAVYTWADQSGNGRDAVQATAGARPLYKANIQNGKPAVLFDNIDDGMNFTGINLSSLTFFAVIKLASTVGFRIVLDGAVGAPNLYIQETITRQTLEKSTVTTIGLSTTGLGATAFRSVNVTYDGANYAFRLNGAADGSGVQAAVFTAAMTALGYRPAGGFYFNGWMGEIFAYDSVLSAGNIALGEAYLNTRWAVY